MLNSQFDRRYTDLLGTPFPIIQAPMAGVQGSALAIAVCRAGGLGSLPCAMLSKEQIVSEIETIKAATDRPFNLNFFCHQEVPYDSRRHQEWQARLAPFFSAQNGKCESRPGSASRAPFSHDVADVIEKYSPNLMSFHFGLPDKDLLERVKSWGTKIISSATTLEEALWLESKGVDAIIAQGVEAGGHRGMFLSEDITTQMGVLPLVSQLLQKVSVPVIAAGGISNGNDARAMLDLGAAAVQIGTAYLLCDEVSTSQLHRAAIKSNASQHTALTNVFSGRPARSIVNAMIKELDYMSPLVPAFPHASIEAAQLKALYEAQGSGDYSSLWCGQNPSGCRDVSAYTLTLEWAEALS